MEGTKKEIKDRIVEVLDKYARTDELKLLTRLGIPSDSFITMFNTIESCRVKKQEAEKALKDYYASKEYNLKEGEQLEGNLRVSTNVYLSFLEELYQCLIGKKKLGEE